MSTQSREDGIIVGEDRTPGSDGESPDPEQRLARFVFSELAKEKPKGTRQTPAERAGKRIGDSITHGGN